MNNTNLEKKLRFHPFHRKTIVGLWKTLSNNIEKDNIFKKIMNELLSLDRDNKPKQFHQRTIPIQKINEVKKYDLQ